MDDAHRAVLIVPTQAAHPAHTARDALHPLHPPGDGDHPHETGGVSRYPPPVEKRESGFGQRRHGRGEEWR